MKPSIIVWDLETVPDLGGFAAANDVVGKSDVEVREAIGDKFPKHIYHSIVCIGALVAHWEPDHWAVDAVGAPHVGERTEKELITAFCDKIAELKPQLVTFNGNSFDLPVLRYRAMVHGVSAPGLSARPYFHRYTEDAIDLCDVFSSFSPQGKATLHEISRVMGLPGKPKGWARGMSASPPIPTELMRNNKTSRCANSAYAPQQSGLSPDTVRSIGFLKSTRQ
jgi:predicted PolB exonuclease-like 3'-5' exonuclease